MKKLAALTPGQDRHPRVLRLRLAASAVLLASVALGCVTTNLDRGYALSEASGMGVAVVSLTRAGGLRGYNLFLDFRGVGHDFASSLPVTDLLASSDWRCPLFKEPTDASPCGRLAVVELPAGKYEFYSWSAGSYDALSGVSSSAKPVEELSKRFEIRAGEAAYLGNVHFSFGGALFRMKILDRRDRDLALLRRKAPNIPLRRVRIDILD